MRRIKIVVEYDGANYCGWQVQPDRPTIQGELERAVFKLTGERVRVVGAGRTDAGVSALGQVAAFCTWSSIPGDRFSPALNSRLPKDISVLSSEEVPESFHPIRDAKGKIYRYTIENRGQRAALERTRVWHVPRKLDLDAMLRAAGKLVGTHDFSSFATKLEPGKDPVKHISRLDVRHSESRVIIEVEGDGFLWNMVRTIVGTLVEVGTGRRKPDWVSEVIAARDRRAAGPTAPAHGLLLVCVTY